MDAPCRYCVEREIGCHSKCSRYQAYNSWREKVREERKDRISVNEYVLNEKIKNKFNQCKRRKRGIAWT